MGLYLPHGSTCMDEGVIAHVRGVEGFACKARNLIMDLVVTSCDEADFITIQGTTDRKFGIIPITV